MSDPNEPGFSAAEPVITAPRRRLSVSLIWVVPIVAAIIALWLTWRHYDSLGPMITISFKTAEGIEAGRTPIRRLNVEIGRVERVELDEELDRVLVTARMVKGADDYLNSQTRFWVVRPRVSLGGVTGLDTLLSGSYIEMDSTRGGETRSRFDGLEDPPLTPEGAPGIRLILKAQDGGALATGSPVYHRGIKVGRIENSQLEKDGNFVQVQIFVDAPYDLLINSNTRFWNASGLDITFGADGIEVSDTTLETLLFGGIAFSNPPRLTESTPVESGTVFPLYESKQEAESQPAAGAGDEFNFVLYFEESVRGLHVGAPVEFLGVRVGRVEDISIEYNPLARQVEVPVLVSFETQRISGITGDVNIEASMSEAVQRGLRARLQNSSLITGQLIVELVFLPDDAPATYGMVGPYPVLPTVPSAFTQIATRASGFLDKVEALPLDELIAAATRLLRDADALLRVPGDGEVDEVTAKQLEDAPLQRLAVTTTKTLAGVEALVASSEVKRLPARLAISLDQLDKTLRSTRRLLDGDTVESPLYFELSTALRELTNAATAVRILTESLEEKPNSVIFGR